LFLYISNEKLKRSYGTKRWERDVTYKKTIHKKRRKRYKNSSIGGVRMGEVRCKGR